jgi:hypothetical protein
VHLPILQSSAWWKSGMEWDESWTQAVDMSGWLREIAGCQIACVGSQIPVPVCLLFDFVAWHIVLPMPNLGWLSG